jgi:hypothetical protein
MNVILNTVSDEHPNRDLDCVLERDVVVPEAQAREIEITEAQMLREGMFEG